MAEETPEQKQQAYLDEYREKVRRLHVLSGAAVRQFLGSRDEGDSRAEYLTGLEVRTNMANVQISSLLRLTTEKLGQEDYLTAAAEELEKQVKSMEEELAVTGWNQDGTMRLDLQAHAKKTANWPR